MSTLSTEQKRELVNAKDEELYTFVKYSVVEAASRQGISPSALMKMHWVVKFQDDGSLKTRTSSPTASRRSHQILVYKLT